MLLKQQNKVFAMIKKYYNCLLVLLKQQNKVFAMIKKYYNCLLVC